MWLWPVVGVGIVVVVVAVMVMRSKRKRKKYAGADVYRSLLGGTAAPAHDPKLEPLRQNLRLKFLHQEDKVDAAIAFERERNPQASTEECMKAAIARWERDNQ